MLIITIIKINNTSIIHFHFILDGNVYKISNLVNCSYKTKIAISKLNLSNISFSFFFLIVVGFVIH